LLEAELARDSRWFAGTIIASSLLLIVLLVTAAMTGPFRIPALDVFSALARGAAGHSPEGQAGTVLFNIRLPRIVASALVGAGLAGAGCVYQAIFRNALVSPDILGVSTGAGLGAALGILLGLPVVLIQLMGFATGLATVTVVLLLAASLRSQNDLLVLVLAGIVVGALASAAIALVKVLADPYDQLPAITFWLLGTLAGVKSADVGAMLPPMLVGILPLLLLRWRIGILSLGDDEARALGVEARRLRMLAIAGATLVTSAAVAVSGVIGWVGLMVPHMGRLLVGPRLDRLLPVSLLLGAVFLVAVDTLARSIARIEVPLGVLTAILGAPVFVLLLARGRRAWSS
jgi:iron complex transport system permease protein